MQSRKMSLIEKVCDSTTGIILSWIVTMTLLPAVYGFQTTAQTSAEITGIYTVISIVRGYAWRRAFNRLARSQMPKEITIKPVVGTIFFAPEMHEAVLAGRKTQTRRIVKELSTPDLSHCRVDDEGFLVWRDAYENIAKCPYGKPGDVLWAKSGAHDGAERIEIKAIGVERIQSITSQAAIKEGALGILHFRKIWDELYEKTGTYSWDANPWVWVVEFERA